MDIGAWLRALGLGQYETTFRESEIDAEVLPDLTEDDLNQLGVPLGHRKRLLKAIAALGTGETAAKPASPALASSPATAAERRPITVMFCDLVGSTSMAAKLDAEDWRTLVNTYLDEASAAVTGLGGHVLKKLGDGLMALFGYPHAQENDAERAVRAALAIQRALVEINARNASKGAPELSARIGLDSGQVVVDATGEVFGEAPNIAARVQGAAEPGSILITAAVQRQTAGLFVAEDRGQHELKGMSAPMTLYRIVRASGGGRRGGARALTPLVGREEELDLLARRWQRARNGEGQLALIVGEPGLGKSRLMEEFHGRLGETPHTWVEWSSSQLLQNTPLHPIAEWGRQRFGADLPAEQRLADLENTLELVGLDPTEYAPLLAPLVDVLLPDGRVAKIAPEEVRRRQLAAMTAWILASARTQPVVLAFEDLHWADPTSLDLMRALAERGAQAPLLIIATARPEFRPPWSVRSHHGALSLSPLDSAQIAKMVRELSSRHALPKDIVDGVSERTGGVPLFIEEVTRLLLERGEHGGAQAIPPTLQQSLAARLDRLGSARETAQIGAVLGRGFSYALLRDVATVAAVRSPSIDGRPSGRPLDRGAALSEGGYNELALQSALERLAEADILFVEGDGAQATYRFKHALIQDAAYDSLLKSRRQALHRRAAEILCESASPEPEAIAHHFTQAGLDDQAIEWWGKAGDQALRRSAFQEAIAHLGKAIAMADKGAGAASLPDAGDATTSRQRVKLQADYSEAVMYYKGFSAEETKAAWARAAELGANRDDFSERSTVRHGQWTLAIVRGELRAAQELASTFLREAEDAGRPVEAGVARRSLGIICYYSGDFLNARIHCERALEECRHGRDLEARERFSDDTGTVAMSILAITSWQLGEVQRANELINMANHRAVELGHAPSRVHPLYWKSILEILRGDAAAALITAKALEDLCKEHGMGEWGAVAEMVVGWAHGRLANPTAGAAEMRQALAVLINKGGRLLVAFFQGLLADLELETSGADSAVARIDEALVSADQATNFASLPFLHRLRGDILLKRNPPNIAPAEDAYQTAIAVAKQQGARSYELLASLSLAKLRHSTGRPVDAYVVLAPALEGFSPTPEMREIAEARALLTAIAESEEVKSATSARQQHARLQVSLANALMQGRGFAVPETMAAFARARELSAEIGVGSERHSATYGVWLGAYMRGELAPMREQAQKFLAEIAARPEAPEAGVAQRISGLTHWFAGEFVEARAHFQQALTIFDPDRDGDLVFRFGHDPGLAAQVCLALTLWPMGEFDRARACVAEMAERLPAVSHPPSLAYAHSHAAMFEIMRADIARAMPHARATAAAAREHDLVGWRHVGAFFEGWAEVHDGDRSLGLKLMKQAVLHSPPRQRGFLAPFFETENRRGGCRGGLLCLGARMDRRHNRRKPEIGTRQLSGGILSRARRNPSQAEPLQLRLRRGSPPRRYRDRSASESARLRIARRAVACQALPRDRP
jgi:class 3 adenylate cyclase/predicted ATPase